MADFIINFVGVLLGVGVIAWYAFTNLFYPHAMYLINGVPVSVVKIH
jgi:hypothetical protein